MAKKKTEVALAEPRIVVDELVTDPGKFEITAMSQIRISKTNRKHFDEEKLQELAANIKEMGVAQPILIRPVTPTEAEPQPFEIVAGERRWRASNIAGLTSIPAMIRTLTDLQAAKIQILENLQRENPHELEEALGYQNLMLSHGYSADQLAAELNKSRSYIYGRLKLCSLASTLHDDFLAGKFSASTALLVARIPVPALQVKAMQGIMASPFDGQPMSFRDAKRHIETRYMLQLASAPFDSKDAKLLASAGSCIKCPKRTGNQPEVFADIDQNICTDPDCHAEKAGANNYAKIADANKKGIPVIEGDEAKEYGQQARDNDEVPLIHMGWSFARVKEEFKNKAVKNLIDSALIPNPIKILVMPDGKVVELFQKSQIQAILEKTGHARAEEEQAQIDQTIANTPPSDAYLKKQEQDRILGGRVTAENKFRYHLYRQIRETACIRLTDQANHVLAGIAKLMIATCRVPDAELIEYYGDSIPKTDSDAVALIDSNKHLSLAFILDMILGNEIETNKWTVDDMHDDDDYQALLSTARHFDIDPDQVRADFEKPVDATPPKRPLLTLKKKPAPVEAWPFPTPNKTETAGAA